MLLRLQGILQLPQVNRKVPKVGLPNIHLRGEGVDLELCVLPQCCRVTIGFPVDTAKRHEA